MSTGWERPQLNVKVKMISMLYTFVILIFIQSNIGEGALNRGKGEKGPPQKKEEVITVLAKAGDDIKITCPVEGDPLPIVEWSKVYTFL